MATDSTRRRSPADDAAAETGHVVRRVDADPTAVYRAELARLEARVDELEREREREARRRQALVRRYERLLAEARGATEAEPDPVGTDAGAGADSSLLARLGCVLSR